MSVVGVPLDEFEVKASDIDTWEPVTGTQGYVQGEERYIHTTTDLPMECPHCEVEIMKLDGHFVTKGDEVVPTGVRTCPECERVIDSYT